MKICFIVGTRPEIIKVAPLIFEAQKRKIPFFIIHSNQHYSKNMDEIFFDELNLPKPNYNLNVGSGKHANQTGNIMIKMEPILEKEAPDWVVVQGDTNTVIAGGLAASKINIKVAHVEAGLRSYDRAMPEETNRVVTDHLSDRCFAVTQKQYDILTSEGIEPEKIKIVGNTIVDSLFHISKKANSDFVDSLGLTDKGYILTTLHRSKNVDRKEQLIELLSIIEDIEKKYSLPMVWPIHPRTAKSIKEFDLKVPSCLKLLEPQSYSKFVSLEKHAKLILTDSGGLQEEACILKTPCVTLRDNTERPETVDVGANIVTGFNRKKIFEAIEHFLKMDSYDWDNPFGDGTTSEKIIDELLEVHQPTITPKNIYSVNVVGLGYMGLPMAALLAEAGHKVHGIDINKEKLTQIKEGISPFHEPGMDELLKSSLKKKFTVSEKPETAKIHLISVPTPHKNQSCDLSYVKLACESLIPILKEKDLVIIESTIKPRTCSDHVKPIFENLGKEILIAHCPERAIPGNTLNELTGNDRIVGGLTNEATEICYDLYSSFVTGTIFKTDATTAETCKLLENTFRDVNIALANEFDQVLTELGVNSKEAIQMANRHPRVNILSPGIGVGGHCIAIDPWFLVEDIDNAPLIKTARMVNDGRPKVIVSRMKPHLKQAKNIGILGVSYKRNIGDMRETPVKPIIEELQSLGFEVKIFDPLIEGEFVAPQAPDFETLNEWADIVFELVNHDAFAKIENKISFC